MPSDAPAATPRPRSALLALALLVPAPTIALLASHAGWPRSVGFVITALCWLWMAALPLWWHTRVDRMPIRIGRPKQGPLLVAAGLGIATAAIMIATFLAFESRMDLTRAREAVRRTGLDHPLVFVAAALYIPILNAALEEYVWRWFAITRCQALLPRALAPWVAGVLFTIHHALAYFLAADAGVAWTLTIGTLGVCMLQAWLFLRYRSVWPAYVHHFFVDIAVLFVLHRLAYGT